MSAGIVTVRTVVYPWDCDHMGHANVAWYVRKFDEGTWALLTEAGLTPQYLRSAHRGAVAVDQRLAYRRELFAGDVVIVRSAVIRMGRTSLQFVHEMTPAGSTELAATTVLTGVHINSDSRTSHPWPEAVRDAFESLRAPDPEAWADWPPAESFLR